MITLNRSDLLAAFSVLGGAVMRKTGIAALKHVLIQNEAPNITISATDMDIYVRAVVRAGGPPDAAPPMLYPWDALHTLVQSLPDGSQVEFARTDQRVTVKSGRTTARFGALDPQEFPPPPTHAAATTFEIDGDNLSTLLSTVMPFVAKESLDRPSLKGIALWANPTAYALEAIGGSTQAVVLLQSPLPDGAETMPPIVLPLSAAGVFLSAVKDRPGSVTLAVGEGGVTLTVAGISVSSKVIAEPYPDFFGRMPKEWPQRLVIDRMALDGALGRLLPLSDQDSVGLRAVVFDVKDGSARLSITNGPAGTDADEAVDCQGPEMRFGLNGQRVRQLLGTVRTDAVTISTDGATYRFDPVGEDDGAIRATAAVRV